VLNTEFEKIKTAKVSKESQSCYRRYTDGGAHELKGIFVLYIVF